MADRRNLPPESPLPCDEAISADPALPVLDALPSGTILVDERGQVHWANRAALRLFRCRKAEDILSAVAGPLDPPDGLGGRRAARTRTGNDLHILTGCRPVRLGERDVFPETVVDVTDRRWIEKALRAAKTEAEKASRHKSQFLANVSHDIRTPLNGIIGLAETIAAGTDPAEAKALARVILKESEHLLGLINSLLDHAKIEAGKMVLESAPVDLHQLVEEVLETVRSAAEDKGLSLSHRIARDVPRRVLGDPLRLRQVLLNLAGNAVKFTEHGSVSIGVERLLGDPTGRTLRFWVCDTGIGIPADKQEAIFESFTQADGTTTRRFGGTGLGMTISRQLVQLMGGKMGLESEPGRGSTFWFDVPLEAVNDAELEPAGAPEAARAVSPRIPPERRAELGILVVEDYPTNLQVICSHLKRAGYRPEVATNGLEALAACWKRKFDLVLMDIQMPVMDGLEATRRLRQQHPAYGEVPIIALTANAEMDARQTCLQAGLNDVITKPVHRDALLETIDRWLGGGGEAPGAPAAEPADKKPARQPAGTEPAGLTSGEPMDFARAVEEFGGDEGLVRTVVGEFLQVAAQQVRDIAAAAADRRGEDLRREAHKIRGGAANLAADSLAAAAAELERIGKSGRWDDADEALETFRGEFERLREFIEGRGRTRSVPVEAVT